VGQKPEIGPKQEVGPTGSGPKPEVDKKQEVESAFPVPLAAAEATSICNDLGMNFL
jgi:hypothetical protein